MNPLIQFRTPTLPLFITFIFACFGALPIAQALLPPPVPDGGYPNDNTAEGDSALLSLTTGENNTAPGAFPLHINQTGDNNTATVSRAHALNTDSNNTGLGGYAYI